MTDERPTPEDEALGAELRDLARSERVPPAAISALRARVGASLPGLLAPAEVPTARPSPWVSGGLGVVLGALVGAAAMHGIDSKYPTIRVVEVPVAVPSSSAPLAPLAPPSAPAPAPPPPASAAPERPPHPAPSSSVSSSSAERRMVDEARAAYARGDLDAALKELGRHGAAYPSGALTEEREALAVRVLVDAKRGAEARARGERFRARYPRSLMLPAVEAALASIP